MRTRRMPARSSGASTDSSTPARCDEEPRHRSADELAVPGRHARVAERGVDREPVQVDTRHGLDELGVVATAEARRDLDHLRPVGADAKLRVGRPVLDPERRDRSPRDLGHPGAWHRTGPDVRERDAERRRLGGQPVGDRERREDAAGRESDHGHLRPVGELLDERQSVPRRTARGLDRCGQLCRVGDERQSLLALPVGRLDDDRPRDLGHLVVAADDPRARLRHGLPRAAARAGGACSSPGPRSRARSGAAAPRAARSVRRR